ncbi:MAG: hypothetical protein M1269_02745 [Chloroflexi bacterium]|nr:hypothetical protein [Chloroflexota bacterium]
MNIRPKQILSLYFNSWWYPAVIFLTLLAFLSGVDLSHWRPLNILSDVLFACLGIAFLGVLSATIWNLVKKRWVKGLLNLAMLIVCAAAAFLVIGFLLLISMFGPSDDGFADHLTIPDNLVVAEPMSALDAQPGGAEDTFQAKLLNALKTPGTNSVTADISSLVSLQQKNPDLLKRYLAVSPAWRLFEEYGAVFATRRWMIGPTWSYTLHGYYTKNDIETWSNADMPDFQSRLTIGFSGKPWARNDNYTTYMKAGDTVKAVLSQGNQMNQSHCVITAGDLVVEVMEQSGAGERRLTKAALNYLNEEFRPLLESQKWETIKSIVPPGSIKQGEPSFELRKSYQPGIYNSEIWVNPGEAGMIYLKAFEVTKGAPLSEDRLKEASNEWVGWSSDPAELFFSNTHFTVYEGDWGKPYAARFEVWFVPDSGGAERKLMEKVFKIEGWQR